MAERIFGNQTIAAVSVQAPPANNKAVCRFQNDSGADLVVDAIWFQWGIAIGSSSVKAVVYSDSSGTPDALLAVSDARTGSTGSNGVKFTLPSPITVTAGQYVWLGVISDGLQISAGCKNGGTIYYNANSYASGPSATFGAASTAPYTYPVIAVGQDGTQSFGRRSIDITGIAPGDGNYQADREHAERVTLGGSDSVSVSSVSVYVRTTSATAKCKAAIYSDVASAPSALLAQSAEVVGSTADTWMTLTIPGGVVLTPGSYWLAFICDTNLACPLARWSGDLCVDGSTTEAAAWPATYPSGYTSLRAIDANDTRGIDIYASYTAVPAAAATGNFLMFC